MTEIKTRLGDPSDLPEGKSCADCVHFKRCEWLISANAADARCDWEPIRFVLRPANVSTRDSGKAER